MPLVGRGTTTNPPLTATVVDAHGEPTEPDAGTLTLTILAPDATVAVGPIAQAALGHPGIGIFTYAWAVPADAPLGDYLAKWDCFVVGIETPGQEPIVVADAGAIHFGEYTYDPTTDVGIIRLNIDDRDLSAIDSGLPLGERSAIFSDAEIARVLEATGNDVNYATARLLITIAGNRNLLVQSRRIGKAEVNFGNARESLMKQAEAFLALSREQPADGIAEQALTDFDLRRIITNTQLRTTP